MTSLVRHADPDEIASQSLTFDAYLVSCAQRTAVRELTLASFRESDWGDVPKVVSGTSKHSSALVRMCETWHRALGLAAASKAHVVLIVEDDVLVNRYLRHNLERWAPLHMVADNWFYGSLYNPHVAKLRTEPGEHFFLADPRFCFGTQAIVLSPKMARYLASVQALAGGHVDAALAAAASRRSAIVYHLPSLVQHRDVPSTWGGSVHVACDFSPTWRAQ